MGRRGNKVKELLNGLMIAALASAASATPALKPGSTRYIVTFDAKVRQSTRDAALGAMGLKAVSHIATNGDTDQEVSIALVDVPAGQTLDTAKARRSAPPFVECSSRIVSIETDRRDEWIESAQISFQTTPIPPSLSSVMSGLNMPKVSAFVQNPMASERAAQRREETWGINRVHAPAAWPITEGMGVKVAVIDTGIDASHPDLGQRGRRLLSDHKDREPGGLSGRQRPRHARLPALLPAIATAKGIVGVAPRARLYAVKVLDADGWGSLSDVIDGIVWAAMKRMDVANISLGTSVDSEALKRAVSFARGAGRRYRGGSRELQRHGQLPGRL